VRHHGAVRAWAKALLWIGVLLACAGVGALIASRSNPFPPEVRSNELPSSPSPSPQAFERWSIEMTSRSAHAYRVGGTCTTDWRVRGRLQVAASARVAGTGIARLTAGPDCDFSTAQVQTERLSLRFVGTELDGRLELRLRALADTPTGSQDLGGFEATLSRIRLSIRVRDGARATASAERTDENGDVYTSRSSAELSG
jgi:hypothetical protein